MSVNREATHPESADHEWEVADCFSKKMVIGGYRKVIGNLPIVETA